MAPRKNDENEEKHFSNSESDGEGEAAENDGNVDGSIASENEADSSEKLTPKRNGNVDEENAEEAGEEENGAVEENEDDAVASPVEEEEEDSADPTPKKTRKPVAKKKRKTATPKKRKAPAPTEDDEDEEPEYEVKEVIDSKTERGVLYYLIRWKGYTANDDTWEKSVDLSCDNLIAAYNKKCENKKQPPKKRKKTAETSDEEEEKEYEVEKVVNMVENKKGRVFRIRWKGYRPNQDTWEPEDNLNCKDLIETFLKKHKLQSKASPKTLREEPKRTKRLVNETKNPRARHSRRSSAKNRKTYYDDEEE